MPAAAPWPSSTRRTATGEMSIGGVAVTDLAATVGTPVYLVDEDDMRARARRMREAFTDAAGRVGTDAEVYYAGKAFLSRAVARWMVAEGLRIDTASLGELTTALEAGVEGALIGLHGNNKSDAELDLAIERGVGRIVVDSLPEVDRVARVAAVAGVVAPVMLRVTTGVHAGGHEFISTAHEDQKFGLSIHAEDERGQSPAMRALHAILSRPELDLIGIHSHIGSQILDATGFTAAAAALVELRAALERETGHLVGELDLGGGIGVAYLPGEDEPDVAAFARSIVDAVAQACRDTDTPVPHLSFEPGRSIAAPAGITLYTVGTIKDVRLEDGGHRRYVAVDGGMGDHIRTALYGAEYHAELVSRASAAAPVLCRVVGKHCESGDIVVRDVMLPGDIAAGDLLAVAATGAYGRSMASTYNLVPRPGVVAVREGTATTIVRRESVADLLALDLG
ncbi:diaminopimelate decarboxylase [Serinibacter salmoneus]|uniref:Diaminopimelate decarboxylase n=1 Tax=Serinibacter salmoneus TaxID=556530 RepID=A0A2A9D1T9_9MICO|nr:diaminopimelate decarboxylase [Serinibacter salmoneus]PFG20306.1 diaminopimelate decarboxylase [Serinibacter salmoneus]